MAGGSGQDERGDRANTLPDGFQTYATQDLGGQHALIAGAVVVPGETQQRPFVALTEGRVRAVSWARHLYGLEDMLQAQATHCVLGDNALYVLLQSQTDTRQSLSQTLLGLAKLNLDGEVVTIRPLDLPEGKDRAYSAYVEDRPSDFGWRRERLWIKGTYFFMPNRNARWPFELSVGPDLKP